MREDQKTRLDELASDLMDEFTREADPVNWTGAGMEPSRMTPDIRGARNWDVKNANQIGALLARAIDLRARLAAPQPAQQPEPGAEPAAQPDDAAEADISKFEKIAKAALKTALERQSGRA